MFARSNEEFYKQCQRLTEQVIAEGQAAGVLRKDITYERLAWLLSMLSTAFGPPYLRIAEREELEDAIEGTIGLLLDGLRNETRASGE